LLYLDPHISGHEHKQVFSGPVPPFIVPAVAHSCLLVTWSMPALL